MKILLSDIHFEILEVNKQSSKEEIKKAFKKQRSKWHPDRFPNDEEKWKIAHVRFIKIEEAYELLKDYDPPKIKKPHKAEDVNFKSKTTTKNEKSNIIRIKIKSSNVLSIGYDKVSKKLQVEFKNGSVYEYYEVPEYIYVAFINSDSKGGFVSNLYKYKYQQV